MQPALAGCFFAIPEPGQAPSRTEKGQPLSPEKRIPELTAAIKKSGLTTGKATIAAQTLYQTAQQYGPNAEAMLAAYEPGQDPKRFASGFQNAYILGTQGNQAALENSKAAAYLSEQQRKSAYELGARNSTKQLDVTDMLPIENGSKNGIIEAAEAAQGSRPYEIQLSREKKKEIIQRGSREETTIFAKDRPNNMLATYARNIPKMDGYYDIVMHGKDTAVWFFDTKIDAYTLSQIIRQRPDYKKGMPIRLLSCNTGNVANTADCVAQLLANELDTTVIAPTDKLYVNWDGSYKIGVRNKGKLQEFWSRKV